MASNNMDTNAMEINNSSMLSKENQSKVQADSKENALIVLRSVTTLLAHVLIGAIVGVVVIFVFRNGIPLTRTMQHIVLCVLGYQLLMAEAFLSLAPISWVSGLKLKHKRLVHWVLQALGSTLAVTGSFIMITNKDVHWNTYHGQFALVALVFTSVSLVNGIASFYAYELRRIIPGMSSRLTHVCFGIIAFSAATICLCFGFDKNLFRNWASSSVADTMIALNAIMAFLILINPVVTFSNKVRSTIKS